MRKPAELQLLKGTSPQPRAGTHVLTLAFSLPFLRSTCSLSSSLCLLSHKPGLPPAPAFRPPSPSLSPAAPAMSSPIRALSPGSSLASYDFFSHSSSRAISSGESDDGSYGSVSDDASSDDDVLLSFSDLSAADFLSQRGALTPAVFSDDEFVLMSRPRSPDSDDLTSSFSALSLTQASLGPSHHRRTRSGSSSKTDNAANASARRRTRKRRTPAQAPGNALATTDASRTKIQSSASPESPKHHSPSKARRKARRAAARAVAQSPSPSSAIVAGLGDRPIVDDVSEVGSESPYIHPELYQTAQRYVSSYVRLRFSSAFCSQR